MSAPKYLFISRKSSHYRYYQQLVHYLGDEASLLALKRMVLPRWRYLKRAQELDIDDLVAVHMRRKEVRHPALQKSKWLNTLVESFYRLRERCRASYYFALFSQHPCNTVIMWNGMKQPNRTPYIVAKACGKNTQLFENGLLPNTTTLDPKGVNALNSMPRDASFYRAWQPKKSSFGKSQLNSQLVARKAHKHRKTSGIDTPLPERYIFVPFQVPNDTQVVCHSPWVKSMPDFYAVLERALTYLNAQPQWQQFVFVIKEHPSWPRSFKELHNRNKQIIFANDNNTQALIESSLAVVTLNSTVGIESLLLGKKGSTRGDAFYNIDGMVTHCPTQQTFNQTLLTVEYQQFDTELVYRFLDYLENEYLLPQSWSNLTDEQTHFEAVAKRLEVNQKKRVS